jgi:hypothetical protein
MEYKYPSGRGAGLNGTGTKGMNDFSFGITKS